MKMLPSLPASVLPALLVGSCALAAEGAVPPYADVPSNWAEPGMTYGTAGELSAPKTILFSAGPDHIIADAEEWAKRGVNGFFLNFVAREWSSDIWARDGKPWTIGESDETFQASRRANEICREIGSETFLKVAFDHCFEWFNDTAWQHIYHNFRQFAIFARDAGCTGIALDIEYCGEQYSFDWEGYDYDGYTQADLAGKVTERMTRVMQVLYEEFPGMVFLTFPEQGFNLGSRIHVAWIEEAARRDAPGGIHYCTESTYRSPNIRYMFANGWIRSVLFDRLLSDRARRYWQTKCTIAAGIWPFGFNYLDVYDPGMPLEEFRQGYAATLMMSPRYNWIYSHNCRDLLVGRDVDKYQGGADIEAYLQVIQDREVVTDPKYVGLAKELRGMTLRDYSADLDLMPVPRLAGPSDLPVLDLAPVGSYEEDELNRIWDIAVDYYDGVELDLQELFRTQPHWMLIGPFPNEPMLKGHNVVYPPEKEIDVTAEYDGLDGKVRWSEYNQEGPKASVDLKKVFDPSEHVCAYALCFVTAPEDVDVQIRLATNDSGKMWLNGELVFDYPSEGTVYLDRDIVPVTLRRGATSVLLKICNGDNQWGLVFRITDLEGRPAEGLHFTAFPPK